MVGRWERGWGWEALGSPSAPALLLPPSPQGLQGFQGDRGLAGEKGEEVSWLLLAQLLGAMVTIRCQPQSQHLHFTPSAKSSSLLVSPIPHQQCPVPTCPSLPPSLRARTCWPDVAFWCGTPCCHPPATRDVAGGHPRRRARTTAGRASVPCSDLPRPGGVRAGGARCCGSSPGCSRGLSARI